MNLIEYGYQILKNIDTKIDTKIAKVTKPIYALLEVIYTVQFLINLSIFSKKEE